MMTSARSAVQLPSSCRMTHRKKHNARSNISALIHLKPLVLQPAVRRCRQDTAIYRKIPARRIKCSRELGWLLRREINSLILQISRLRVREIQTSSKLQKPQSELSRKMQTVPGISLTSIRMVSTRLLCQGARRNTDKNTQHICRQSQQWQIRRAQGFRQSQQGQIRRAQEFQRSQSFQSHRAQEFRQSQSPHNRRKKSVQRFQQEWSLSKLRQQLLRNPK